MSIKALEAIGDLSLLMPMISRQDDRVTRLGALAAIRDYLGRGPEAATRVREQLIQEFGERTGAVVGKMLLGYTAEGRGQTRDLSATRRAPFARPRLGRLCANWPSIRSKRLTGRVDLGYNPDHPADGKGLNTWRELQRKGDLRPPPKAPKSEVKMHPPTRGPFTPSSKGNPIQFDLRRGRHVCAIRSGSSSHTSGLKR